MEKQIETLASFRVHACSTLIHTHLSIQSEEFGSKMSRSKGLQVLIHDPRDVQPETILQQKHVYHGSSEEDI